MPRRVAALLALTIALVAAAPAAAATERVSVTFAPGGAGPGAGAAVQIYGSNGLNLGCHVSFTGAPSCSNDIAGTHVTTSGNTISFVDDVDPSTRCFRVTANDTDGPTNTPNTPVSVSATYTHPDGSKQDVGPFVMNNGDRIILGATPPESSIVPGAPQPFLGQCMDGSLGGDGPNRPPVARPDRWSVRAGWTADENALLNDYDPDGDRITARVTRISFAKKEWSGMDRDGGFLYTAGPGTRRTLRKTITYHVVDSHGARSASTTAIVTVKPPKKAKRKPMSAALQPYWWGPWPSWARLCFGSGLDSYCYTIVSVARTRQLNALKPWTNLSGATDACIKFGFIPLKNTACAASLFQKGLFHVWDKSVVSNATKLGDCVMFRVDRNRSLRHPLAGEWGKPQYRTLDSLVSPFNGNQRFTGWGTWGKNRVPMFCDANGRVWGKVYQPEVPKP
jgi:Bacterial Ig domain